MPTKRRRKPITRVSIKSEERRLKAQADTEHRKRVSALEKEYEKRIRNQKRFTGKKYTSNQKRAARSKIKSLRQELKARKSTQKSSLQKKRYGIGVRAQRKHIALSQKEKIQRTQAKEKSEQARRERSHNRKLRWWKRHDDEMRPTNTGKLRSVNGMQFAGSPDQLPNGYAARKNGSFSDGFMSFKEAWEKINKIYPGARYYFIIVRITPRNGQPEYYQIWAEPKQQKRRKSTRQRKGKMR